MVRLTHVQCHYDATVGLASPTQLRTLLNPLLVVAIVLFNSSSPRHGAISWPSSTLTPAFLPFVWTVSRLNRDIDTGVHVRSRYRYLGVGKYGIIMYWKKGITVQKMHSPLGSSTLDGEDYQYVVLDALDGSTRSAYMRVKCMRSS